MEKKLFRKYGTKYVTSLGLYNFPVLNVDVNDLPEDVFEAVWNEDMVKVQLGLEGCYVTSPGAYQALMEMESSIEDDLVSPNADIYF